MTVINLGKIIVLVIFGAFLSGCMENSKMKEMLQEEYDGRNANGNRAFCYYIGNVTYPYLAEPVDYISDLPKRERISAKVNQRLSVFEKVGLLSSSLGVGADGEEYSLYNLTEEGAKHSWSMQRNWGSGIIANEQHFCFGRRIIEDVTSIKDKTTNDNGLRKIETIIHFKYRIENLPSWSRDVGVQSIYGNRFKEDGHVYTGQVWLTKKNGQYYNYSSGATIGMEQMGYYLL